MPKFTLNRDQFGENKAINPFKLDHIFASGKYKDKTVQEVIDIDRGYIRFCMENIKGWSLDNEAYNYYKTGKYLTKTKQIGK